MTRPNSRPNAWQLLAAAAVGGGLLLSTKASDAYAQLARIDNVVATDKETLRYHSLLHRFAESPGIRLMTDDGRIDIHQGERTVFADPYRFKLMVEAGQIDPQRMRQLILSQEFQIIITYRDIFSDDYFNYDFGLPATLVKEVRSRYKFLGNPFGRFLYERRKEPSPE